MAERRRYPKGYPGVTTVLGKFKDPGALMYWSWKIAYESGCGLLDRVGECAESMRKIVNGGCEGSELLPLLAELKKLSITPVADFKEERQKAADIGSACHAMAYAYPAGEKPELDAFDPETIKKAEVPFSAFVRWSDSVKMKIEPLEEPLISIDPLWHLRALGISPEAAAGNPELERPHNYAGTPDSAAVDDQRAMVDYKTGNIYPEAIIQGAAYIELWNQNYPWDPITGGLHILRFSKETGDFTHRHIQDTSGELIMFSHLLDCYNRLKETEKRLK